MLQPLHQKDTGIGRNPKSLRLKLWIDKTIKLLR